MTAQLKLIALDADDLAVISAHVQDAGVQAADIIWRQSEKRLVVGMSRLDWEQTLSGGTAPRRLISALRFDRVLACKSRNIDLEAPPDTALELLGIEFHPGEAPGGSVVLLFNDGGALAAGCRMPRMRTGRSRQRRSRHQRRRCRALGAGCVSGRPNREASQGGQKAPSTPCPPQPSPMVGTAHAPLPTLRRFPRYPRVDGPWPPRH